MSNDISTDDTIYLDYRGEKMSNDISTDVQYIQTIGGKKCQMILVVQMITIYLGL